MAATIEVNQEFIEQLAEAIAKANLRAAGMLPGSGGPPSAPEASQPLHSTPQTVPADPWATDDAGFNAVRVEDTWPGPVPATKFTPPAEDPFSTEKPRAADPWAADPLADAIQHAADVATLTALWKANQDKWNDSYTEKANVRKGELTK